MSEPYCLAMILCDAVHTDAATGKKTILGTFSTVGASQFPASVSLSVYFSITEFSGDQQLEFRIVNSEHTFQDDVEPIAAMGMPIFSPSPLAVSEGEIAIKNLVLETPGVYHCELCHSGEVLMSRRLVAMLVPNKASKDD